MGTIATWELIAGAAAIGTAGYAAAGGFKGKPAVPKVAPMPDQMVLDEVAQKKAALAASRQTGRASTVLSSNTDTGDRLGP